MKNKYVAIALIAAFQGISGASTPAKKPAEEHKHEAEREIKTKSEAARARIIVRNEFGQDIGFNIKHGSKPVKFININNDKIGEFYLPSGNYEIEVQYKVSTKGFLGESTAAKKFVDKLSFPAGLTSDLTIKPPVTEGGKGSITDPVVSPYVHEKLNKKDLLVWHIKNSTGKTLLLRNPSPAFETYISLPNASSKEFDGAIDLYDDGWDKDIELEVRLSPEGQVSHFMIPWAQGLSVDIVLSPNTHEVELHVDAGEGKPRQVFRAMTIEEEKEHFALSE